MSPHEKAGLSSFEAAERLRQLVAVVDRGDEEECASRLRQTIRSVPKGLFQPPGQRNRRRRRRGPRSERTEGGRKLHQRQRIAAGEDQNLVADTGIQTRCATVQQLGRFTFVESLERQLPESAVQEEGLVTVTYRRDQRDLLGLKPPSHKRQDLAGRIVEPLNVVENHQQGPVGRSLRHQFERAQADQEHVGTAARADPECTEQRIALALGQPAHPSAEERLD